MPLPEEYGQVEIYSYVGQLSDLHEQDGPYGVQIVAEFKNINPEVLNQTLEFFRASRDAKSKWMRWLGIVQKHGIATKNPNDCTGLFFHIERRPETYELEEEGEEKTVVSLFPYPVEITSDEARAKEIFEGLPKPKVKKPPMSVVDWSELEKAYKSVNGEESAFAVVVGASNLLPEGYTMDEVYALAKQKADLKTQR